MSLTINEIAAVKLSAEKYDLPLMYSPFNYSTSSRRMKGSRSRTPQWIFDQLRVLNEFANNDPERGDWETGKTSTIWAVTGNWGALPLAVLEVPGYEEQISNLTASSKFYLQQVEKFKKHPTARLEPFRDGTSSIVFYEDKKRGLQALPNDAEQDIIMKCLTFLELVADGKVTRPTAKEIKAYRSR